MHGNPWTHVEDSIITYWYAMATWDDLFVMLPGRSKDAIRMRANYLGVVRQKSLDHPRVRYSKCEINVLTIHPGWSLKKLQKLMQTHSLSGIKQKLDDILWRGEIGK